MVRTTLEAINRDLNGNGKPGLKTDVEEIKATARASLLWMKAIAILVGIFISALGLYISYLEVNHRIGEDSRPSAAQRHAPQSADLPDQYQPK